MAKITIKTIGGEMVDQLAHQHYGENPQGTNAILEANPGLAKLGPILPSGIDVDLPDLPDPEPETVKLWD